MAKTVSSPEDKPRGRPRSEQSREAILIAALKILVRDGYQKLTIEGVAREAGTGKSTIYRWWDGRSDLAIDAFFSAVDETLDLQDTGSAEADFRAQILGMANQLRGPTGRAFAAMLAGGRDSPAVASAVRKRWLDPRRDWARRRIAWAAKAGQLHEGVEPRAALALLYSPLYSPLLFGNDIPAQKDLAACVDLAAQAIFVAD
ncbi:TetR/AcrR family transcriptional regulator [Erythrobacter sp. YJ-T3-07]|uniref:TetR/AcrR family transcriptional regulator n=1 Tax=Erythrobacter sp. YJ-T3-07 TaxID=2793063 RepID=UPI0018D28B36|nr:TetR/AcrR family transcriptional regulator [Erythrobacter sp. YJ-T3-07]MBH1943341.1 TetR/AcrR family transcriptional regulator [Erythrobacter sp. YJ-T3-07]